MLMTRPMSETKALQSCSKRLQKSIFRLLARPVTPNCLRCQTIHVLSSEFSLERLWSACLKWVLSDPSIAAPKSRQVGHIWNGFCWPPPLNIHEVSSPALALQLSGALPIFGGRRVRHRHSANPHHQTASRCPPTKWARRCRHQIWSTRLK